MIEINCDYVLDLFRKGCDDRGPLDTFQIAAKVGLEEWAVETLLHHALDEEHSKKRYGTSKLVQPTITVIHGRRER